jgi:hypothetical protein
MSHISLRDPFELPLRRRFVSNTPSMSRKHLPAAVLVSIGRLTRLQGCPTGPDRADDVLQVPDAAGEPVDPDDHQHVPEEVEHGTELLPALGRGPRIGLFRSLRA